VLVGTISIETSEHLSQLLKKRKVLNIMFLTRNTMKRKLKLLPRPESIGAITIATNMAGRGTDIMLGGNP
jgi:preprotein translocase subunit SecA